MKPQNGCVTSLYVLKSLQRTLVPGKSAHRKTGAYFITSLSDGSSDVMSRVRTSRCRVDISGNGADVSSPSIGLMSLRMSLPSPALLELGWSLIRAGMLFWPRYLVGSGASESTLVAATWSDGGAFPWTVRRGGPVPNCLGQPSFCLFSSPLPLAAASGDRVLLRVPDLLGGPDALLLEDRWFGL